MDKRIDELDFVRVFSMLAIIALHVTGAYIFSESSLSLAGMNPAFLLNQLSRFAVPAFIALSGLSLGLGRARVSTLKFYAGRLLKLGVPYVIWFCVYLGYGAYKGTMTLPQGAGGYIKAFLTGSVAPHLYFVVVIFQLYLLYPLLKRCLSRNRALTLGVCLALSLWFQCGIYLSAVSPLRLLPAFIRPYAWLLFPTWIFFFALGAAIDRERLASMLRALKRFCLPLVPATLLAGFLYALSSRADGTYELSIKPQLFVYVPLVFAAFLSLGAVLRRFGALQKAAGFLAKHSMTVYFLHVLVLNIFISRGMFQAGMSGMLKLLMSVTALSIAGAALIDLVVSGLKGLSSKREKALK